MNVGNLSMPRESAITDPSPSGNTKMVNALETHSDKKEMIEIRPQNLTEAYGSLIQLEQEGGGDAVLEGLIMLRKRDAISEHPFNVKYFSPYKLRGLAYMTLKDPKPFEDFLSGMGDVFEGRPANGKSLVADISDVVFEVVGEGNVDDIISDSKGTQTETFKERYYYDTENERALKRIVITKENAGLLKKYYYVLARMREHSPRLLYDVVDGGIDRFYNKNVNVRMDRLPYRERYALFSLQVLDQLSLLDHEDYRDLARELAGFVTNDLDIGWISERYDHGVLFNNPELWESAIPFHHLGTKEALPLPDVSEIIELTKKVGSMRRNLRQPTVNRSLQAGLAEGAFKDEQRRREVVHNRISTDKRQYERRKKDIESVEDTVHTLLDKRVTQFIGARTAEEDIVIQPSLEGGLVRLLQNYQNHPELSSKARTFIQRNIDSLEDGKVDIQGDYRLDFQRLIQDPTVKPLLEFFSVPYPGGHLPGFLRHMDPESAEETEFLLRYLAYKVLCSSGVEPRNSGLLFSDDGIGTYNWTDANYENFDDFVDSTWGFGVVKEDLYLRKVVSQYVEPVRPGNPRYRGLMETIKEGELSGTGKVIKQTLLPYANATLAKFRDFKDVTTELVKENKGKVAITASLLLFLGVLSQSPHIRNKPIIQFDWTTAHSGITDFLRTRDSQELPQKQESTKVDREIGLQGNVEQVNTPRFIGQIVNTGNFTEGQALGFLPTVVKLDSDLSFNMLKIKTEPLSPTQARNRYRDESGLLLRRTIPSGGMVAGLSGRETDRIIFEDEAHALGTAMFNGIMNLGTNEVEVVQVLSDPLSTDRVRRIDDIKGEQYQLTPNWDAAQKVLASLKSESSLAVYYEQLLHTLSEAQTNGVDQEEISQLIEMELHRLVTDFVDTRFYQLDHDVRTGNFAQTVSYDENMGFRCEVAVEIARQLFDPLGIQVGTISGDQMYFSKDGAWTGPLGHVNNIFSLPDGRVIEANFTPKIHAGKTPESDIEKLGFRAPSNVDVLRERMRRNSKEERSAVTNLSYEQEDVPLQYHVLLFPISGSGGESASDENTRVRDAALIAGGASVALLTVLEAFRRSKIRNTHYPDELRLPNTNLEKEPSMTEKRREVLTTLLDCFSLRDMSEDSLGVLTNLVYSVCTDNPQDLEGLSKIVDFLDRGSAQKELEEYLEKERKITGEESWRDLTRSLSPELRQILQYSERAGIKLTTADLENSLQGIAVQGESVTPNRDLIRNFLEQVRIDF